jgi:hypothetical protein
MPLVRIDVRKGKDAAYRQKIGRIVYDALVSVGVPEKDRFQIIAEHEADGFQFDPEYLGIQRSADLVIIQITWNEGRTTAQKKRPFPQGRFLARSRHAFRLGKCPLMISLTRATLFA